MYKNKQFILMSSYLGIILFAFILIAYYTGLLTSGFRYFIDDNQIFLMNSDLANQGWFNTVYKWILYDRQVSRFRPYYQLHIVTLTQFLGLNSVLWFLYITILGALTCFFLFLFGRILNFSLPIALLFSLSILLGSQSELWVRPLIPDAVGMFFLSLSLFSLSKICRGLSSRTLNRLNQAVFLLSTLMMSLSKESYILFIPTLAALRVYLPYYFQKQSFRVTIQGSYKTLAVLTLILITQIVYVIFFLGTQATGYAGVDENSFQLSSLLTTSWQLMDAGFIILTILAIIIYGIIIYFKKRSPSTFVQELIPFLVILLVALIPQTVLYAKSGITAGFYLFPFITIGCLLLAKTLSLIEREYRSIAIVFITVLSIVLISRLPSVWTMYYRFAEDSRLMNELLTQIKICAKPDLPILVVANPKVRFEAVDSLQRVLRTKNHQNLILAMYGLKDSEYYSTHLANEEPNWDFLDVSILSRGYRHQALSKFTDKKSIQAIIIFDGLEKDFKRTQNSWFTPENYKSQNFAVSFASSSLYCKR